MKDARTNAGIVWFDSISNQQKEEEVVVKYWGAK